MDFMETEFVIEQDLQRFAVGRNFICLSSTKIKKTGERTFTVHYISDHRKQALIKLFTNFVEAATLYSDEVEALKNYLTKRGVSWKRLAIEN